MLCYWGAQVREGLGLVKPDSVKHENCGINSVCPKSEIQDVSAGGRFLGFVRDGKVSVLRLRGEDNDHDSRLKQLQLKDDKIRSIMCGGGGVVLLSHEGKVLIMDQSTTCMPLKGLNNKQVIQITCGDQHSMALTHDGQLFAWGENLHGQLGLGEGPGTLSPQHIQCLCGIPLAQISAGGDHSFALSLSGAVFGWGKNNAGQLGLGDNTNRQTPTCVKSLNYKKTVFISCGEEHTAILTKGGIVFTCGSGSFGQLGHNSLRDEYHPRLVAELMGSKVSQIACGRYHTLALSESVNVIYSFGCGEQGQLGNGKMINQSVPLPVHLPSDHKTTLRVKSVIAGGNSSVALCHDQNHETGVMPSVCATLDDKMIDRWVAECDTNAWSQTKRKIQKIFSSASCLNGSFIEKSCEKHFLTSTEYSGLDLSLARLAFKKIAKNKKVLLEVKRAVVQKLLPSLKIHPDGVEAFRIYLILPELIRVQQKQNQQTTLAVDLAAAVLKLEPNSCDALERLWTTLPASYFKTLVKAFHSESERLITEMTTQNCDHWNSLITILTVQKRLFLVNRQRKSPLMESKFSISQITNLPLTGNIAKLIPFSFVTNSATQKKFFVYLQHELLKRQLTRTNRAELIIPVIKLQINRQTLLEDTLHKLRESRFNFSLPLQVVFIGENGIDQGGLSAEFFSLFSQAFLTWKKNPLKTYENLLVWFNSDNGDITDVYYLGIICGMALYNYHYINIDFPLALFKKLLDLSPTLNDLEELSPVEARGLKDLLNENEEVVDKLYLDFMVKGKELIPNGGQIPVTKINRQKYVDLYVDFIFNKSVKNQFEQFSRGFSKGCPIDAWRMFHPEDLREIFYGSPVYEWEQLHKCATYECCFPSDDLIMNFWNVFFEFAEEDKKKFLFFMYGTERAPAGGLSKLSLTIVKLNCPEPDDRFPLAQTCSGRFYLPSYGNIDTLRDRLTHAINYCDVFGLE